MKLLSYLKKKFYLIVFCTVNALLLLTITITWINKSHILTDDEEYLIKGTLASKNFIAPLRNKPAPGRFIFINLAWEKQLVNVINEKNGQIIGKRAITNRDRIAKFLEYVNRNPKHKFILLDVWFKDSSNFKSDSLLQVQLNKTKNILIPYHKDDKDDSKKDSFIFNASSALSDYEKDDFDNNFAKFRLVQGNNFKTTPLVLYEQFYNKKFTEGFFGHYMDNQLSMNSFILDLRISNTDFIEKEIGDTIKTTYNLTQLADHLDPEIPKDPDLPEEVRLQMSDNFRANLIHLATKDKIIVIGDFEDTDIHQTLYGPTPGPLILLNVFLALENGDNLISLWFILFLFSGYFFVSYKCFTNIDLLDQYLIRPLDKYFIGKIIPRTNFRDFIMSFMGYLIYFILLSLLSYFLFNIHLTILLLAVYMETLERAIEMTRKRRIGKNTAKNETSPLSVS